MRMNVSKGNEPVLDSKHHCPPHRGGWCIGARMLGRGGSGGMGQLREGCLSSEHLGSWEGTDEWLMGPSKISEPGRPWPDDAAGMTLLKWQSWCRIFGPNSRSVVIQGRAPSA